MYAEQASAKADANFFPSKTRTFLRSRAEGDPPGRRTIGDAPCACEASLRPLNPRHQNLGGAERDRTADPLLAKQVLSQLSYSPNLLAFTRRSAPRGRRISADGPWPCESPKASDQRPQRTWTTRTSRQPPNRSKAPRPFGTDVPSLAAKPRQRQEKDGGPGQTRTADLTLIRRAL